MLLFLLIMIFGIGFSVFATQNTHSLSIYIGNYSFDELPAYLVLLGAMTIAFALSAVVYLMKSLSSSLTTNELRDEVKELQDKLAEITKTAHKLELENIKYKKGKKKVDENGF